MADLVVFDFDKTITRRDTVFGFFRHCGRGRRGLAARLAAYLALMVAARLGLITLDALKRAGVALFLRGLSVGQVDACARAYAREVELSEVFGREFAAPGPKVVVSASFRDYVEAVVGDVPVIGSELAWQGGRVSGMKAHCHGRAKVAMLRERFPDARITALYTDSFADRPLMELASEVYWVRNGVASRMDAPARDGA